MGEILDKANGAGVETNVALFKHILDYEAKLDVFLNKTGGWIREQEECIWRKMFEISGEAGAPLCTSLDIIVSSLGHPPFVSSKPLIPEQLTHCMRFRT